MNIKNLPIGSIVLSNNTRLIIVGYNKNDLNSYLVCTCNKSEVIINKIYILNSNQIEKVLSLGYVDLEMENIKEDNPFSNKVVPTNISNNKYVFDANGYVIGEN